MSEVDIKKWLSNVSETVSSKDLNRHMDLISENVVVYGMPGGVPLSYADWRGRRKHEFKLGLLKSVGYNNLRIKNIGLRRLTFNIDEVMDATNGDLVIINKDVILEQEQDKQWRSVEESIRKWTFLKHNK